MARPPSAASILRNERKQERQFEPKTPIATGMFLPNHSGIKSHPEFIKAIGDYVPYTGATSNVDLNSKNLTTTGTLGAGATTIDTTSLKAFLVRKTGDTGDVFWIDTTNNWSWDYSDITYNSLTLMGVDGGDSYQETEPFAGRGMYMKFGKGGSVSDPEGYSRMNGARGGDGWILGGDSGTGGNDANNGMGGSLHIRVGAGSPYGWLDLYGVPVGIAYDSKPGWTAAFCVNGHTAIEGDNKAYFRDVAIYIASLNADYLDLHSTKDTRITCGANYTLTLATSVYDDLQFQISNSKVPAANYPNWEAFTTSTFEYAFGVDEYIYTYANEIPHWWKQGTAGNAHLHFTIKTIQNSGANRFAKFEIIFAYADTNEVWVEQTMTGEYTIPTGTAALTNLYVDMGNVTLTNYLIGTQIKARVKRIAATGGTEYADDVYITQAGIHLQKDTMGSRNEITK